MPNAEKLIVTRIRRLVSKSGGEVKTGIGDDCAVLRIPPGHEVLVTTDFSLEGVHFRRNWHSSRSVGHRCLTRGLSDIAAMGGKPIAAFLSLALPSRLPQSWVDGFIAGMLRLAKAEGVVLAGGDIAESQSGVSADVVVLGSVPIGHAVLRSGAWVGDHIYVTGSLGGSAAALDELLSGRKKRLAPATYPGHFFPSPRVAVGRFLARSRKASAMIDISDGLSTDLAHICEESGVGATIMKQWIPRAPGRNRRSLVALEFALHGGDDYELLFTASPKKTIPARIAGVSVTQIGTITKRRGFFLVDEDSRASRLTPGGWEHFRR